MARRDREVRYRWELALRSSPEQLWPLVADTDRFDRDAGTPAVERLVDRDAELGNGRTAVRQRLFGLTLEYEQDPFEWREPETFAVVRRYRRGPLARLAVHGHLAPAGGGTRVVYEVAATPRSLAGRAAIPIQIGRVYRRRFEATFRRYDELASVGEPWRSSRGTPRLAPGGRERLDRAVEPIADADLARRLNELLAEGDDLAVGRIRPYALADGWARPRPDVLRAFLQAARHGAVAFRWDVLCPACGVAKATVARLDELPRSVHCSTCNIDAEANFDRSVELTFRVSPAIRDVATDEYCIGAPMATPHVVTQTLVPPGGRVHLHGGRDTGRYRLRAQELPGALTVSVLDGGADALRVELRADGWPDDEPTLAPGAAIEVVDATGAEQLVMLDRTAYGDQAVTAAEVTAMQDFRDLFAREALRPRERISVGALTVVFTDLAASTELYRRVGDAVAFGHVLDHFDVLRAAIGDHGGTVVKTLGDAVMAVFRRPAPALRALLDAQQALATTRPGGEALSLKAGVHHGPCIAVTLNGVLDYFGTTVNLAARLEGQASGAEIVVSDAVRADPEVAALLGATDDIRCVTVPAALKGFTAPVPVHRLSRPI